MVEWLERRYLLRYLTFLIKFVRNYKFQIQRVWCRRQKSDGCEWNGMNVIGVDLSASIRVEFRRRQRYRISFEMNRELISMMIWAPNIRNDSCHFAAQNIFYRIVSCLSVCSTNFVFILSRFLTKFSIKKYFNRDLDASKKCLSNERVCVMHTQVAMPIVVTSTMASKCPPHLNLISDSTKNSFALSFPVKFRDHHRPRWWHSHMEWHRWRWSKHTMRRWICTLSCVPWQSYSGIDRHEYCSGVHLSGWRSWWHWIPFHRRRHMHQSEWQSKWRCDVESIALLMSFGLFAVYCRLFRRYDD